MAIINALPQGGAKSGYKHKVEITTSSTWTVPTGVTEIAVRLFGGGGAGFYNSTNSISSGGGGGNMAYGVFSVTAGTPYAITIGSGATGSSVIGGSTSFGDLLKATGGEIGTPEYGGSGGTGGGTAWAVSSGSYVSGYAYRGGYGTYGGGGAGAQNWYSNGLWYFLMGKGGIYGGQGGGDLVSDGDCVGGPGVEGEVGGYITDSTSYAWGGGGGGYKANGGNNYYGVALYGGGGGGWEGGAGGSADSSGHAGGGGGYGSTKLDITGTCGGTGYGAGAGGDGSSSGAPGICIIYY